MGIQLERANERSSKTRLSSQNRPETQEQYWSMGIRTVSKPEEEDRVNAVLDILKGDKTAEEVRKKYDITSINSIYTWIGKYVSQEKVLSLEEQTEEDMANKSKDDQIRELKAKLRRNKTCKVNRFNASGRVNHIS